MHAARLAPEGRARGIVLILLAAAAWGLLGPVSRVAFAEGVEPLEVAFWRAVAGGALFGLHAIVRGGRLPEPRDVPGFAAFALIGGAMFFGSYQLAVASGGAALAAVLLYTAPAWVACAGVLWLNERMTRPKLLVLLATLAGVKLIAGGSGGARYSMTAILWGLVAGLSYASYYVFGKLYFDRYTSPSVYAFVFPVAAVALLPFVSFAPKSAAAVGAIVFIGVVSTYAAYLLYAAGLRLMEASRASIIATIEPVVAGAVAHLWWGERFAWSGYAGAVLILLAVVAVAATADRGGMPETP